MYSVALIIFVPYFTDDRSIFFSLNTLASTYTRMKLKKNGIPKKNLDKNDDFIYSRPWICCRFFFWIRRLKSSMFLGNKSTLTRGAIPGKKCSTSEKKSIIFNDWSVSENQFNIELYNEIYTIKMYVVEKKSQGGSFYNIKLLSQNI